MAEDNNYNKLHPIDVPVLGANFGQNIKDTFDNIDANFNILNNKDLTTGPSGLGMLSFIIPISELLNGTTYTYKSISYDIPSQEDAIRQSLLNLDSEAHEADVDAIINQLNEESFDILINVEEKADSGSCNILYTTPFVLIDKRFLSIENIKDSEEDVIDMSCIMSAAYDAESELTLWFSTRCFPNIKYDKDSEAKFFWNIYGANTSIPVAGQQGIAGKDGNAIKLGGFTLSGGVLPANNDLINITHILSNGGFSPVTSEDLSNNDIIILYPLKLDATRFDQTTCYMTKVQGDVNFQAFVGPNYILFSQIDPENIWLSSVLDKIGTDGNPEGLYIPTKWENDNVSERWIFKKGDNDELVLIYQRKNGNNWSDVNNKNLKINGKEFNTNTLDTLSQIDTRLGQKQDKFNNSSVLFTLNNVPMYYGASNQIPTGGGGIGNANYTSSWQGQDTQNTAYCPNTWSVKQALDGKQIKLIDSGENDTNTYKYVKTINGQSLFGTAPGNIIIESGEGESVFQNVASSDDYISARLQKSTSVIADNSYFSLAEGNNNNIAAAYAHAEGCYNTIAAAGQYAHAEGTNTTASNSASHAEGSGTTASGVASHAEGWSTTASGDASHAEGNGTTSSGTYSHAEGYNTTSSGTYSHAEGNGTTSSGAKSHAEGQSTKATNDYSHAEGYYTTASGSKSHAEGQLAKAEGVISHAEGYNTTASGQSSHAEGYLSKTGGNDPSNNLEPGDIETSGAYAHAEGNANIAKGIASHAEGRKTFASGQSSHAEGYNTTASGQSSHAEGGYTTATGDYAHAEGNSATALGDYSHAEGWFTLASGEGSHAGGLGNIADSVCQTVIGKYADIESYGDCSFVIGAGISDSDRSNLFAVDDIGQVFAAERFIPGGADYAEYFEWADGNPDDEDRIGRFVTLEEDKIRLANKGEEPIGVISGTSGVVGNDANDHWDKKYLTDIFGRHIYEDVEVERPDGTKVTEKHQKLNPDYDPNKKYIPRSQRPEWDIVGLLGQLIVIDNGKCVPGQRCGVGKDGIAIPGDKYRVMKRLDKKHIKILASFI